MVEVRTKDVHSLIDTMREMPNYTGTLTFKLGSAVPNGKFAEVARQHPMVVDARENKSGITVWMSDGGRLLKDGEFEICQK